MSKDDIILKKNMELAAILEVSKVLTASFDLRENLDSVMRVLARKLDMQRGCVFLLDPASEELKIVAAHGLTLAEIEKGKYKIGEGVVGRVIDSAAPMVIPDIGDEPIFLNKTGSRQDKRGISFICVPITIKDRSLGVISADRIYAEEHGSVADDLRVLSIVASLIAQFVTLWETFKNTEREREQLRRKLEDRFSLGNIVGESERFNSVLKNVKKVAGTGATVLLLGESGTGKELIANTLHFMSERAKGPFIAVNCAALPDNLLEVELFGCEKGAFTGATSRRIGRFESARGGTIFLDEIGEMPFALQAKLLRVLQEKTFERVGSSVEIAADVRVIAATNRNLLAEVRAGRFREDLYWRLNVVPIVIPPLRERAGDVKLLANYYVDRFNGMYKKRVAVSEEAINELSRYAWPGNVRELANTLERLVIMNESDVIEVHDLPFVSCAPEDAPAVMTESSGSLRNEVFALERERIVRALKKSNFVQHRAASALGITPRQMGYRIKKYEIDLESEKRSMM